MAEHHTCNKIAVQWRIQDFPELAIIWTFSPQKLHEIERIWSPKGGAHPRRPLRSAKEHSVGFVPAVCQPYVLRWLQYISISGGEGGS